MKGYIYLLRSLKNGKKYLGSTLSPNSRVISHNRGYTKSTRNDIPWACDIIINVGTIEEARRIERYIKSQKEILSVENTIKLMYRYYCHRYDVHVVQPIPSNREKFNLPG